MAMTVLNNTAAALTIGELNKNISSLNRQHKKVSSGMKLNSAGDDASAYAISERMRAQIRSLDQDVENVKNGRALLKVAAGGIDNIIDELRNIKELAINSANDTNTDKDRATLQKEYEQKIANINDIVAETNYNGKILLDGRYGKKTAGVGGTATQSEPVGTPIMIYSGDYTISADGIYMLARGYTGTVSISDGVSNVEIQQEDSSTALNEAFIVGPSNGNVNLWIDALNIYNETDKNIIDFKGQDNYLVLKNNNSLTRHAAQNGSGTNAYISYAGIHIGDGLTIESTMSGALNITMITDRTTIYPGISAAGIGTNDGEDSTANLIINSGNINVRMSGKSGAAAIGSGYIGGYIPYGVMARPASMGNIEIHGGTITVDMFRPSSGGFQSAAGIGAGDQSRCGNIYIDYANVNVVGSGGAGIGSGALRSTVGNIKIGNNAIINATSYGGAGIGSGSSSDPIGEVIISRQASITARAERMNSSRPWTAGEDVGAGYDSPSVRVTYVDDLDLGAGNIREQAGDSVAESSWKWKSADNPLIIHHGTKANQALNCYINDMDTEAMGLSNTKISTRDDAIRALSDDKTGRIGAIDAAIEYAVGEATTVGAYISRLEHTEENLVTANENTQASESTIRDADMAKEMAEYTKYSLLTQSSQAMLAQANQNGSQVLSLLQ